MNKSLKLVIIGDMPVGKTCVMGFFCDGIFPDVSPATIGVGFKLRTVSLDGECIKIQLWDTPGPERYASITNSHLRHASGVALVYDVTDQGSFDNLDWWLEQVRSNHPGDIPILLLGNKCDLHRKRVVDYKKAKAYADQRNIELFIEISAKEGTNVEMAFISLIALIKSRMPQESP